jgi:hypothetical protein
MEGTEMTIVSMTVGQPLPGADPAEIQKAIREACDLATKHGAENVTVLSMVTGAPANTISVMSTVKDWIHFGKVRQAIEDDPKFQALTLRVSKLATGQTYIAQTVEV